MDVAVFLMASGVAIYSLQVAMNTIIKLLRDQCLPYLNDYYKQLLEQANEQSKTITKKTFTQSLRSVWGFSHVLQDAGTAQDIIIWLDMLNTQHGTDIEKELKRKCREQAKKCFEQISQKTWPDEATYQQVRELLYQ